MKGSFKDSPRKTLNQNSGTQLPEVHETTRSQNEYTYKDGGSTAQAENFIDNRSMRTPQRVESNISRNN